MFEQQGTNLCGLLHWDLITYATALHNTAEKALTQLGKPLERRRSLRLSTRIKFAGQSRRWYIWPGWPGRRKRWKKNHEDSNINTNSNINININFSIKNEGCHLKHNFFFISIAFLKHEAVFTPEAEAQLSSTRTAAVLFRATPSAFLSVWCASCCETEWVSFWRPCWHRWCRWFQGWSSATTRLAHA